MPGSARIQIGHVPVDVIDFAGALARIEALVEAGAGGTVFTPNVDHVVLAEKDAGAFREAYAAASLSVADGMPLVAASKLLGRPLPERVAGSDLIRPLMARAARRNYSVYLLGGASGVAERAREVLQRENPGLCVAGVDSSRIDVGAVDPGLVERVRKANPSIVLIALGAPKQEIFCQAVREQLKPAVLLGIGASLDFIAGVRRRAPTLLARVGLEWAYRLAQEPRRLGPRYLRRDPLFFWIIGRQLAMRVSEKVYARGYEPVPPTTTGIVRASK